MASRTSLHPRAVPAAVAPIPQATPPPLSPALTADILRVLRRVVATDGFATVSAFSLALSRTDTGRQLQVARHPPPFTSCP